MSGGRDAFSRYRDQLEAVGFKPSTARGQNFLLDPSLHRWIADQAAPSPKDTVIEIGVGLGFLTRELAQRAGHLLAVEIEPRLLAIAQRELAGADNVEWLQADALGGAGNGLAPRIAEVAQAGAGRVLVVANLPYSVSGPLLAELAQLGRVPDRVVVLVQKELGQRLAAKCGSDGYGGLSGLIQAVFDARSLRDVSPEVFRPRPKVWSSVVSLERRDDLSVALAQEQDRRRFALFLRKVFGQRRKALRRTFAIAAEALGCSGEGLPDEWAHKRAEALPPEDLVTLWQSCERGSKP